MTGHSSWFGIFAGALTILLGVYSLLQTEAVAGWLEKQRVYSPATATGFIRRIRILGVLFILAGAFFVAVAIKNY